MVSVASLFTRPVRSNILIQLSSRPSHRIRKRLPSVDCTGGPPPPLKFAVRFNSTEVVIALLEDYPDISRERDDKGMLPVHMGCQ